MNRKNGRRANRNQASPLEAERLRVSFDVCDVNRPASLVERACNFYIFPGEPLGLRLIVQLINFLCGGVFQDRISPPLYTIPPPPFLFHAVICLFSHPLL